MEPTAECVLVVIGATPEGKKELLGFRVGVRESAQSWRELLVDLMARGLAAAPELAVGDGAPGFWKALEEVLPEARHQRCWFHKIANVLNTFPKSMHPAVTADLREISRAQTRAAALAAIETFREKYVAKYARGVACLTKDVGALLSFHDFPAGHWDHLRTSNPIESIFATGCGTSVSDVFDCRAGWRSAKSLLALDGGADHVPRIKNTMRQRGHPLMDADWGAG